MKFATYCREVTGSINKLIPCSLVKKADDYIIMCKSVLASLEKHWKRYGLINGSVEEEGLLDKNDTGTGI